MQETGFNGSGRSDFATGNPSSGKTPLRVSAYTYRTESLNPQYSLVFNAYTGSLLELTKQEYDRVQPVLDGEAMVTGVESLDKRLLDAGIVIPEDFDEIAAIRSQRSSKRLERDYLGLTIAPTLECNFRCDYCFESHPLQRIDAETEKDICEFIRKQSEGVKGISITWYGGEPLMALDTIIRIQKYVNALGEELNIPVSRDMITNGYLLGPKAIEKMKQVGEWGQIQVTLDGEPETHNKRRILVSGKGTWERIVDNCEVALDSGLPLVIRMNIDATTHRAFDNVIQQLLKRNILPRAGVYLGCVSASTPTNEHVQTTVLHRSQFADAKLRLAANLLNHGLPAGMSLPVPDCTLCTADIKHGYVIAPTGLIFKCWEEIAMGSEYAVGHVAHDATPQQKRNAEEWDGYDPLKKPACVDCTALPVCMGGCPLNAMKNEGDTGDCSAFRFHPLETIQMAHGELAIKKLLDEKKEQTNVCGN